MNRLEKKFRQLKKEKSKALSCFITAGYPDIRITEKVINALCDAGADVIELGVPFSDPIADGPVIQYSSMKALKKGISLGKILRFVSGIRRKLDIPIVLMTYLNPVFKFGLEKFFIESKKSGVDGLIVPDIIPEEGRTLERLSQKNGISLIYLLSSTTSAQRQKLILGKSRGFVYVVSVTGVTGERKKFDGSLEVFLKTLKKKTKKPLLLGFGISSPEQITGIRKHIDGIIIGSAIIKVIKNSKVSGLDKNLKRFLLPFRKELDIPLKHRNQETRNNICHTRMILSGR